MNKSKIDVAVALIFFIRTDTLREVFNQIRKARPNKLFLIQDGARPNNSDDIKKIQECRDIVNQIDWECEVYRNYSNTNLGCGLRPPTGISWVFEHVEEAIILEDDCVPSDTFFPFCKELLDRYKYDLRIGIISGLNYHGGYDFGGYSYGYVKSGAIWGWATWKNRWIKYDFNMSLIKNQYIINSLKMDISPSFAAKKRIKTWEHAKSRIRSNDNVSFWDYQWGFTRHVQSWLSIVPKYNQISNIGIGADSTHAKTSLRTMPKKIAAFFYMKTVLMQFPLAHPEFVVPDREYDKKYYKIIYPGFFVKVIRKFIYMYNRIELVLFKK